MCHSTLMAIIKNARGNLPVIMIFSLILASMTFYIVFFPNMHSANDLYTLESSETTITNFLANMQALILNPRSWAATYNDTAANPNLKDCLKNEGFTCPSGGPFPLVLKDAQGNIWLDSRPNAGAVVTSGFDPSGRPCSTFNGPDGGPCQYQYIATWTPACPVTGACILPPIEINFTLNVQPPSRSNMRINTANSRFLLQMRIN